MRILFLASDIDLRGFAGDVSHVEDLASAFSRIGCSVDLVVAEPGRWRAPPRVVVHKSGTRSTILSALALLSAIHHQPPDVIYERRTTPKLAALLALLANRPYFVEVNGLPDDEAFTLGNPDPRRRWGLSIRISIRKLLLRAASKVVAVTEELRAELIRGYGLPPSRVVVVPNGVDLTTFHVAPAREARAALGLPAEFQYVLFAGNLVPWEGVSTLIRAMHQVVAARPSVRLLIVGDGPERNRLEDEAGHLGLTDVVRFVGSVPHGTVRVWISAADLCALPLTLARNAKIGTSAIKLKEYLACGKPVVASNVPGAGPYVEEHGVGVGVAGDDAPQLANAILTVLGDTTLLETMGRRADLLAREELSWDRSAGKILRLVDDLRLAGESDRME